MSTVDATFSNTLTGPDSANSNNLNLSSSQNSTVTTTSAASNNVNVQVNTGQNTVSNNTVVGNVSSGAAQVNLGLSNQTGAALPLAAAVSAPGDVTVNSSNSLTGSGSTNSNTQTVSSVSNQNVTNNATVFNSVSVSANTGGNLVSNNTQVGSVSSGSVNVGLTLSNSLNSPSLPVASVGTPPPVVGGVGGVGDVAGSPVPVTTPTPSVSTSGESPVVTTAPLGMGGDNLPLATLASTSATPAPTATLASVSQPLGVGGGVFPAGSPALATQATAFMMASILAVYGSASLRRKVAGLFDRLASLKLRRYE